MAKIIELMNSILKRLEDRGIAYPDSLYTDVKTVKTTLDGISFLFESENRDDVKKIKEVD